MKKSYGITLQRSVGLAALLLLTATLIAAIVRAQPPATPTGKGLQVAASYYPLYEFARQVGGTAVTVTNVTPAGTEPHEYEPSPQTLAHAQRADVFIYNGGAMEPWASGFLSDYRHTVIKASAGIALLNGNGDRLQGDPHFWLDPVLAQQIIGTIRDGFIAADPAHADAYRRNAAAYDAQLQQLDHDFAAGLRSCQTRTIITSHQAFSYLAKRYGLTVYAIAGIDPDQEPDTGTLAAISRKAKTAHVRYIFFEKLVSPRLAETVAREAGVKTLVFDPIEGIDETAQKNGKNYLTVQRDNLGALRAALACR